MLKKITTRLQSSSCYFLFYYHSFPFIFNNLNISTITNGANTNNTISNICSFGNNTILNIFLSCDVNSIININDADTISANISFLLLNGFDLNTYLWLFLILNMCTNSDSAST